MKRGKWTRPESRRFLISLVILLAVENSALSAIRYVPSRDYRTIQSAIDAPSTVDGDEVVVAPGVYTGPGNIDLDFKGKAITVRSQINPLNPNWNTIAATVIDCGGPPAAPAAGDTGDANRAFWFHTSEGPNSKVLGFTIRNGYARGQRSTNGRFAVDPPVPRISIDPADPNGIPRAENGLDSPSATDPNSNGYGGGILCENGSSPTIKYCVITDCIVTGGQGGDGAAGQNGTWQYQPPYDTSDPNATVPAIVSVPDGQWGGDGGNGYGNGHGGAIACLGGSSPLISDCIIKDNAAHGGRGGDGGAGGNAVSTPVNASPPNYNGGAESFGGNGGIGFGDGMGGGIYCENASAPTIVNCTFSNNVATTGIRAAGGTAGQGNAIPADDGGPATDGADGFVLSSGGIAGGAAYYSHPSDANFTNCTFTANMAYEAYIFYDSAYAYILGEDISAYTVGGAVYSDISNNVTINTCDFKNNMGGAIYCDSGCTLTINNTYDPNHKCLFMGNSDPHDGSDLHAGTSGIDFGSGGAIYLGLGCVANIQHCVFGDNSAKNDGGALKSETNITLKNCSFSANAAANGYGGAMDVYTSGAATPLTIDVNDCSFSENQALIGGGFSSADFIAVFANCYFVGNTAGESGGLDLESGDISISNSVIAGNIATDGYGGGLNCSHSTTVKILHCVIVDNLAGGSYPTGGCGGAINFGDQAPVQRVFNCLITGNSATVDGGAISCYDAMPEVNNCTFDNSFAGGFGGAIFSDWSSLPQITNCIFRNCNSHAIHEEDYGGDASATYCLFYNNSGYDYYESAGNPREYNFPGVADANGNFNKDPLFVSSYLGGYYLSQSPPQAPPNSPAVDSGFGTAISLGLNKYTTCTNDACDVGPVDRGYHYRRSTDVRKFQLTASVVGGHGTISKNPDDPCYPAGTIVTLTATPSAGWRVKAWTGTDNNTSTEVTNTVVMYSDRTVTVEFRQPKTLIVSVGGGAGYYSDIQDAVTDANDGDTVVVYPGVYYSAYLAQVLVVDKSILITSRYPDDPTCVAATVIDGFMGNQFNEGFNNLGVWFTSNTDKNTVLNGFTIRNCGGGFGIPTNGNRNAGHPDGYDGGCGEGPAIIVYSGAAPVIKNCVITDNVVFAGDGGNGENATNTENAGRGGWAGWARGGAVYCAPYSNPAFINCQIIDNQAVGGNGGNGGNYQQNGGMGNYGGSWSKAGNPSESVYNIDSSSLNYTLIIDGQLWELWEWYYAASYWPMYGDASRTSYFGDYRWYSGYGGGAYCDVGSDVTFTDCIISGNLAQGGMSGQGGTMGAGGRPWEPLVPYEIPSFGGGVYCAAQATVEFTGCSITDNISSPPVLVDPADPNSGLRFRLDPYLGHGGGVCAEDTAAVVFNNCTFSGNQASVGGGLNWADANPVISDCNFASNSAYSGGGLFGDFGLATIIGCDITNNEAVPDPNLGQLVGAGGGVHCWSVDANIMDCYISSNQAEGSGGGVYFGGGDATPSLKSCLITDNSAGRDGGGVSVDLYADVNIVNCTIAGNIVTGDGFDTGYGGGLYCSYNSYVNIINSIIWNNTGGIGAQGSQLAIADYGEVNVTYSDIQDATNPSAFGAERGALDLVFCIDTTFSMYDDIAAVKAAANQIVAAITAKIPDSRIAVVDYKDFNQEEYGETTDYPYRTDLVFTNNTGEVVAAINSLVVSGGFDWPESVYAALMHCLNHSLLAQRLAGQLYGASVQSLGPGAWRPGNVLRVIILIGDAPPHDPEPFTNYTLGDIVAETRGAEPKYIISLLIGNEPEAASYFGSLAAETGGTVLQAAGAGEVVQAIMNAIDLISRVSAPIFIDNSCVLNWDPNTFAWSTNSHNIDEDPLFVGGYYLSQVAAGQDINSPAVDAGSDLASVLGMDKYTTRIDGINDVNIVDMGYHYPPVPMARPKHELVLTVVGPGKVMVDPNEIDPNNPLYNPSNGVYTYKQYKNTVVRFTAIPASGYRVKSWNGTNKDPSWNKNANTVKMDGDKAVRVEFERVIKQNILVPAEYRTIEEAVAAAGYGDTNIIVSQGVHYVSDPNGIDFRGKSITLMSTYPDVPEVVATTIIDCQGDRDTPRRAFHFHSGEDANTIVTGLTIRNGYMRGPRGAAGRYGVLTPVPYERIGANANDPPRAERGSDATGDAYGGGILCENASSPTIKNCVITNCTVTGAHGGEGAAGQWVDPTYGVQQWYYLPPELNAQLQQTNNGQWGGHGGTGTGNGFGGSIACRGGSKPIIINCVIKDNVAMGGCGGDGGDGGYSTSGQESWGGNGGNAIGDGIGGGIYCENGSTPVIADCNFINNVASTGTLGPGGIRGSGAAIPAPVGPAGSGSSGSSTSRGRVAGGAAYYGISSDANFVDCTFFGNKAYELYPAIYTVYNLDVYLYTRGGALYSVANNNVTLNNCTFTGSMGGAFFIEGRSVVDVNKCLFEDNKVSDRTPAYYYYSLLNPGYVLTDYERGGGAIYIGPDCSGVSIRNTNFHSNSAFYDGGAISCESDANFINCLFGGNEASRNGGAIEAYYDAGDPNIIATLALNLESCCFAGNQATEGITGWGGAVHFQDFNATLTYCQFINNTARNGGGLFLSSGAVNMIGGIMHGNKAIGGSGIDFNRGTSYAPYYYVGGPSSGWGYILYGFYYYTPYLYDASDNVYYGVGTGPDMSFSVDIGGGAVLADTHGRIENFTITDNTVEGIYGSGGAINFYGGYVTHVVKNCLITGNSASVDGGAISANLFATPQIQNCTFGNNTAGDLGGAIFYDWGSSPVVKDSIFRNCNSHAIVEEDLGDPNIKYCLFYGNQNGDYGVYNSVTQTTSTIAGHDLHVTNIAGNPLFVTGPLGGYYLSQTPVQASNSPALNAGSGLASSLGMDKYTTRTDGVKDAGKVDIGFHYADHRTIPQFHLTATVVGGHGRVEPTSGTYYAGTSVTITAIPDKGWRVAKWSGTINDDSMDPNNVVIMGSNRTVTVQFGQPRHIVVGSDPNYTTIQHAIDAAADGDVVIIPTGTYTPAYPFPGLRINKGITLTSTNPDDPVCVRATVLSTYRLFVTTVDSEAIIDGITIRSGGIDVYSCSPTIRNCVFTECRIQGSDGGNTTVIADDGENGVSLVGGAMIIYNGSPTVQNCLFTDCSVTGGDGGPGDNGTAGHPVGYDGGWGGWAYGGAVYIGFGSNPTFEDCDFVNCYARGGNGGNGGNPAAPPPLAQGGRGGSWEWADSIETGPMTSPYWYWWDGWQYAPYDANGAPRTSFPAGGFGYFKDYWKYSGYGGAVYVEVDSSPKFINCSFRNNHTYGGVCGVGGVPTLPVWGQIPDRNLNIENFGGAIYACNRSNLKFISCEIANNVADTNTVALPDDIMVSYGGGVAYEDNCLLNFVNCTIANNTACIGGGVYWSESGITVADSSFSGNDAYAGGGLYTVDSTGTIAASSIIGNRAFVAGAQEPNYGSGRMVGQGGGYCCLSSVIEVNDSIFGENEASFSGGGIYFAGSDQDIFFSPSLDNCLFTDNIAGRDGGGVSVNWNTDLAISNCTIADNKVTGVEGYGGGLYCSYDSNTVVIDSIIWDNGAMNGSQVAVGSGFVYEPRLSVLRITYTDIGPPYDPNAFTVPVIEDLFADGSSSGGSSTVLVDSQAIYSQFDTGQGLARVIVSISEPVELKAATDWDSPVSVARFRSEIANRQMAVLSTLTSNEFTLRYRYQNQAGFSGEITRAGLERLLSHPLVVHIEPVRRVHPALAQAIPLGNALDARRVFDGKGMAIAIVDTGVDYTHPMLGGGGFPNSKVIGGYDTGSNDPDPMPVGEAHGTCCAGIAAGDLGVVGDYIGGVAPSAKLYALKASPDNAGSFLTDAMLAAWDWCITHRNDNPKYPIKVMSNSWGMTGVPFNDPVMADAYSPAFTAAADTAVAVDIAVLAASGNDGYAGQGISWPSAMSKVISVGAVNDTTDQVMAYSDTADILDVLAPADPVYTTDIVGPAGYSVGDYFSSFNGTSSACPFAAGCVADIQTAAKAKIGRYLTPGEVKSLLIATGDPVTDWRVAVTKPRVNLGEAVAFFLGLPGPPIYIEKGCELNGWEAPDSNNYWRWDASKWPNSHNIEKDPNFICGYYLSQILALQSVNSPAVNAGSALASVLGMDKYTTRVDGFNDAGVVDMGYHYRQKVPKYNISVIVPEDPNDPGIHGTAEPLSGWYYEGTKLTLKARANPGYYLKGWYDVNDILLSGDENFEIVVDSNEVYIVRFRLPKKIQVSGGGDAIGRAVSTAENGDILIIAAGTYDGGINLRGKHIELVCTNPDDPNVVAMTIINCQQAGRGFIFNGGENADTVVDGFTIINGNAVGENGGGIYVDSNSSPTVMNVVISNCVANNGQGGGIFVNDGSRATFINCTVNNCNADEGGGAFCDGNSAPIFDRCTFRNNSADVGGGMYCGIGCIPDVNECTFSGNVASQDGGGLFCGSDSEAVIADCNFAGNSAVRGAGAYCERRSATTVTDSVFSDNTATTDGGAMYWLDASMLIVDSNIVSNQAIRGGGLWCEESGDTAIIGCTIGLNQAGPPAAEPNNPDDPNLQEMGQGGGLYCFGTPVLLRDCIINRNVANTSGGGVYLAGDANSPQLANCLIINNSSGRDGGGVSINWYARPFISNCTFAGNATTGYFGAPGNSGFGGGLYCSYHSNSVVVDSIFWNNFAVKGFEIAVATGFEPDPRPAKLTVTYCDVKGGWAGIQVDQGCTLLPADNVWLLKGSGKGNNIDTDPLFVSGMFGGYYLSQTDVGDPNQTKNSPCVDVGSDDAGNLDMVRYTMPTGKIVGYTTRTDGELERGFVDMGYHYSMVEPCRFCDLVYDGHIDFRDFAKFASKWLNSGCSDLNGWCNGGDLTFDKFVNFDDLVYFAECWLVADTEAPIPNPSEWEIEPYLASSSSIRMVARTAFDAWGWNVEYYFDCVYGNCHDKSWQASRTYTDTGLTPEARYGYRVKARDQIGNETEWSVIRYAGQPDTTPPAPPPTWAVPPYAPPYPLGENSIAMEATAAYDDSGIVYYGFWNETRDPAGNNIVWQGGRQFTDVGLDPNTRYCYRVKARDGSVNQNETVWSEEACATTLLPVDTTAPTPAAQWDLAVDANDYNGRPRMVNIGGGLNDWYATMRAVQANDPSGVEYQFVCTNISALSSQWQSQPAFPTPWIYVRQLGNQFVWTTWYVIVRDQSPNHNYTQSETLPAEERLPP